MHTGKTVVGAAIMLGLFSYGQLTHAQILTFSPRYESKLFIGTIPPGDCAASATRVVGGGTGWGAAATRAAFRAFCRATSLAENPTNGAILTPLDARIRGDVTVTFKCQAGNPLPLGPTSVVPGPTAGGPEINLVVKTINGVVNPPATRDNIVAKANWGFVLSGHPEPNVVERGFTAFRGRATPDIWHKFDATIRCGVDARGLPTYTISRTTTFTWFPSHRVWFFASPATPAPGALNTNLTQRSFGDLWFLPPIPAP